MSMKATRQICSSFLRNVESRLNISCQESGTSYLAKGAAEQAGTKLACAVLDSVGCSFHGYDLDLLSVISH